MAELRSTQRYAVLAIAGANLTLVQFFAMREFAALLGSNELVTLMVASGFFLGLSAGYLASDRLSPRVLIVLGALTLALHFTLPFSARYVTGWLAHAGQLGEVPPFVFALTVFGITPFYAVFLPRILDRGIRTSGPPSERELATAYATEITGGLIGLAIVLALGPARMALILTVHLAGLVALLLLLTGGGPRWRYGLVALPLAYLAMWPRLDRGTLAYFYENAHGYVAPSIVASEFSPYERVDLVEAGTPDARVRFLFLNGILFYGTQTLHQHNLLVSILPNLMVGRGRALVIAGGSLDNARYLAVRTSSLHVVELDETVVRLTRRYVQDPRGGFPTNWQLVIDDGKHFLGNWASAPFDVISVDAPVPAHLQTAMLHSERFMRLAASRLAPGGIFSISLTGQIERPRSDGRPSIRLANRILAGVHRAFPYVIVVRVDDRDYAWGSDRAFTWSEQQVQAIADRFIQGEPGGVDAFGVTPIHFLEPGWVERCLSGTEPIGEADVQAVLRLSWSKFTRRFYRTP